MVHFHGGLVNRQTGLAMAERLGPIYENAGGYPLFFLWQSGFGETIAHSLSAIGGERIFKRLLARILQFLVGKARETSGSTRGIAVDLPDLQEVYQAVSSEGTEEPFSDLPEQAELLSDSQQQQFLAMVRNDSVIQGEADRIAKTKATNISPEVLSEIAGEVTDGRDRSLVTTARLVKGALATVKRVVERQRLGRSHGLYATAVEELLREFYLASAGRLVWQRMKQETTDAFGGDGERFAGTGLLEELAALESSVPVLVGHSAGALYVCNFLAKADALLPEGRDFDVVLLAPACDFQTMERALTQHGHRLRHLRIFCMKDEVERKDRLLLPVYPHSLLYFVSGVLESRADWPLLGMERFHSNREQFSSPEFPEIESVRAELEGRPDSTVWSVANGRAGLTSEAVRHGDFDDDGATLNSLACFISET